MTKKTKATEPDDETVTTYGAGQYIDLRCGDREALAVVCGWWLYDINPTVSRGDALRLTDAILFVAEGKIP